MVPEVAPVKRPGRVRRGLRRLRLPGRDGDDALVVLMLALVGALVAAVAAWDQARLFFVLLAVLAGLLLPPRPLLVVYAGLAAGVAATFVLPDGPVALDALLVVRLVVLLLVMALMFWMSRSRAGTGVTGLGGERMLVDLRDRLRLMGEMPALPSGWHAESALESAYGDAFSGDFMVTARNSSGTTLEIVLVDVSGKGLRSGTRSLLLSGAFSGLLGATDAEGFLPAANTYLLRQSWGEGFATAVHLQVCTTTGAYSVATAGHPPAVKYSAGSGRWEVVEGSGGPLLGVLEQVSFPRRHGVLKRGDALLLYTDGVIETRTRQLADGIDRMLGTAERSLKTGFSGLATRLCAAARSGEDDDRAVVVVWRT